MAPASGGSGDHPKEAKRAPIKPKCLFLIVALMTELWAVNCLSDDSDNSWSAGLVKKSELHLDNLNLNSVPLERMCNSSGAIIDVV